MKLMLIFPRMKYQPGDPPLGICGIASHVKKTTNAKVSIIDTTFKPTFEYIEKNIQKLRPDMIGIYTDTLMYNDFVKVTKIAKKYGCFVFTGGPHPTVMPETVKPYVDAIIPGESEITVADLVNKFPNLSKVKGVVYKKTSKAKGKESVTWITNPPRPYIQDLDSLDFPAVDMVDMEKYIQKWHQLDAFDPTIRGTNIMSSRGCPYNCSFCQPNLRELFGEKVRHRSPENVIAELKFLKKKFKLGGFFLHDDTFNIDGNWVKSFCHLLVSEKLNLYWACNARINTLLDIEELTMMRDAGLRMVHTGVESASQRVLNDIYRKGIKVKDVPIALNNLKLLGIQSLCFFMLGAPTETKEEIRKTIKFAVSLNATEITASITTPLPGSKLYEIMKDKYPMTGDFSQFDYYKSRAFEDENLTFKELKRFQLEILFKFYAHPKRWAYILKHFISINGIRKMWSKIRRFV